MKSFSVIVEEVRSYRSEQSETPRVCTSDDLFKSINSLNGETRNKKFHGFTGMNTLVKIIKVAR